MTQYCSESYHLKPISLPHNITSYWQTPQFIRWNHIDFLFKLYIVIKLTFQQILQTYHYAQLQTKVTMLNKQHTYLQRLRATAVRVWRPLAKKSKLSRKPHLRTKQHVSILYTAGVMLLYVWKCEEYRLSLPPIPVHFSVKSAFRHLRADNVRKLPISREHGNRHRTHLFVVNYISHLYFSILQFYSIHFDAEINPH